MSESAIFTLKERLQVKKESLKEKFKEKAYETLTKTVGQKMADYIDDWEPSSQRRVVPQVKDGRKTVVLPGKEEEQEERLRHDIHRLKEMGAHGAVLREAIMQRRHDYPDLNIEFADERSKAPVGRGVNDRGDRARSSYGR